jgi:hypothetical protein
MNAIVFEHVPIAELPPAWREKLALMTEQRVTVRIEAENEVLVHTDPVHDLAANPLFGMWRDRDDMADVVGFVRAVRAPRFGQPSNTI